MALLSGLSVLQGRISLLLQRDQLLYGQVEVGQSLLPATLNPEILCGAAAESQGDGVELGLGDGARFAIFFQGEEFLVEALTLGLKLRNHLKRVYSLARVPVLEKRNSRYRQTHQGQKYADGYDHEAAFLTPMPTRMPG